MKKLVLAPLALAVLAACATHDRVTPAPAPVVVAPQQPAVVTPAPAGTVVVPQPAAGGSAAVVVPNAPGPLRVGVGSIDSITPVPNSSNKRVGVRMADNSVQYLDTAAAGVNVGDRVEITADGYLKRPAP